MTIFAQIFVSANTTIATAEMFTPLAGTLVTFSPPITSNVPINTPLAASLNNISVAITAKTRMMLVFYCSGVTTDGSSVGFRGYASGGIVLLST